MAKDYATRADGIREELTDRAEREANDMITRAKSSAAMQKRNLILQTKGELMDAVFDKTLAQMKALGVEQYTALVVGLLSAAMLEQAEAEEVSRELYGEEDSVIPAAYEILMNARDRERCGEAVVAGIRKKLMGKLPAEKLEKLCLSEQTVLIDGGAVLRYGDVESNCSFALLFAQLRTELESQVSRALFDGKRQI